MSNRHSTTSPEFARGVLKDLPSLDSFFNLYSGSHNPFATRYTRPGSLPFFFASGDSLECFHQRLIAYHWRGQIVGPHGTGKSTLLGMLDRHWTEWGRVPVTFILRNQQRRLPAHSSSAWNQHTQVIVDGYEQLSRWSRWQLIRRCRRCQCGLLFTSHQFRRAFPLDVPLLIETTQSRQDAVAVASHLLRQHDVDDRWLATVAAQRFDAANGNVREMLFLLYDDFSHAASLHSSKESLTIG